VAEFDFPGLLDFLTVQPVQLAIVQLRRGHDATASEVIRLKIDNTVEGSLRRSAQRAVASLRRREVIDFDEGWLPYEHEVAVANRDLIAGPLFGRITDAYGKEPGQIGGPTDEDETDDDAGRAGEDQSIRAYALVAQEGANTALVIRRQNPVKTLGRRLVTAVFSGDELTQTRRIFVYDGRADLVVWNNQVLVVTPGAYERLFGDPVKLEAELQSALQHVNDRVRPGNMDAIREFASDQNFARGLRKLLRGGALEEPDMPKVLDKVRNWGVDEIQVEGGRLVVGSTITARWQFLHLLDDGYLLSDVTGHRYEVNSKRQWIRFEVAAVTLGENDRVTTLVGSGPWSPASAANAIEDIKKHRAGYYHVTPTGSNRIITRPVNGEDVLWSESGDGRNALLGLAIPTAPD
jgi:hypothetical protein